MGSTAQRVLLEASCPVLATSDLYDEHGDTLESCHTQFRMFGTKRHFRGTIVTIRCHEERTAQGDPVSFGGALFMPGRELVNDEDGIVVLP
jgi:regulator of ribonuclease activity A